MTPWRSPLSLSALKRKPLNRLQERAVFGIGLTGCSLSLRSVFENSLSGKFAG